MEEPLEAIWLDPLSCPWSIWHVDSRGRGSFGGRPTSLAAAASRIIVGIQEKRREFDLSLFSLVRVNVRFVYVLQKMKQTVRLIKADNPRIASHPYDFHTLYNEALVSPAGWYTKASIPLACSLKRCSPQACAAFAVVASPLLLVVAAAFHIAIHRAPPPQQHPPSGFLDRSSSALYLLCRGCEGFRARVLNIDSRDGSHSCYGSRAGRLKFV